jgi:plastocyanin
MRREERMTRFTRLIGVALTAAVLAAGPTAIAWGRPAHTDVATRVKIVDFKFKPGTVTILVGTKVKWINKSATTSHTSTSDTGVWNSGVLAPGQAFVRKFTSTGTFNYHCSIHPFMTGTVQVNP